MKGRKRCLFGITGAAALLFSSCAADRREVPASPPLQRVVYSGSDVICRLDPSAALSDVMDLRLFQGVKDDPPLPQLQSRLGQPEGKRVDERSTEWVRFDVSLGHIEAGNEREESGNDVWFLWRTYAVPDEADPKKLFHTEVLKHLDATTAYTALSFEDSKRSEGVWCSLRQGAVERCRWFSLRGAASPSTHTTTLRQPSASPSG